jgi:IS605 OrfB family transposase
VKQTISTKLKLKTTPEQFRLLRSTQLAYRDALNCVSQYAFANGKTSSNLRLHQGCYRQIRSRYHLPSQMACSVEREVCATYKGLWSKLRQNTEHRKMGFTRKRFKELDQAPHYGSPTLTYHLGHDYSFRLAQQVSILTLSGRLHLGYSGYQKHLDLIEKGAEIGAAKLWYDQPKKQFYLIVSLQIEVPDPQPEDHRAVIGVDVGIRYLAVTSDYKGKPTFHSGKQVRHRANHCARLRQRLQRKGTRSATRRLKTISRRERRLKQQANHQISTTILKQHPHALIGIEDLSGIRERTRRRTRRRKKNGKGAEKVSRKQRRANSVYSKWSFAQLQSMLAYKATLSGSMVVKVDADYTSKGCPKCGFISEKNRPDKGLLFCCVNCQYRLHADLVGARNLTIRTLVVRQDWMATGHLSVAPGSSDSDVSANEAKAARLQRYAELRWMPDASPRARAEGD